MILPQSLILEAWNKAEAKCQCSDPAHNHYNIRCKKPLEWEFRGKAEMRGSWDIHGYTGYGPGKDKTFEILCCECYRLKKIHHE